MPPNQTEKPEAQGASEQFKLTFPPFPQLLEDSTLPAFKNFKPSGIQMFSGDGDVEIDGLGIETVEMRTKHDTDAVKTGNRKGTKRVRKAAAALEREAAEGRGEPVKKLTWWEEWEESEDLRVSQTGYPLALMPMDRLHKAARDFTESRRWPSTLSGVREFWNQYQLYVGLLVNTPVHRKPAKNKPAREDGMDDEDGTKGEDGEVDDGDDGDDDDDNMDITEEVGEERLMAFLNDPVKSMQIFLSSYMRERGLIWYDRNLHIAPRLGAFFINFLLRNHVLPEPSYERSLRRVLDITTLATKELPLTAKIGRALPDELSIGLTDLFGRVTGSSLLTPGTTAESWSDCVAKEDEDRQPKKQKLDGIHEEENGENEVTGNPGDFEAELKAANVEVIQPHNLPGIEKEVLDDNIGMDVDLESDGGGWGSGDPAWGEPNEADKRDAANWHSEAEPPSTWGRPQVSELMKYMGPTTLPLTHTTGIVEQSTRRIKNVILPAPNPLQFKSGGGDDEDPDGVEDELEKRFAKVVLEPWIGEERSEIRKPVIRMTSKGEIAPGALMEDGTKVEGHEDTPGPKLHDPFRTNITLLVDLDSAELLQVGMGLQATWIQLIRLEEKKIEAAKKKKSKSKNVVPKGYWYMEELLVTFVSFYTEEKASEAAA